MMFFKTFWVNYLLYLIKLLESLRKKLIIELEKTFDTARKVHRPEDI